MTDIVDAYKKTAVNLLDDPDNPKYLATQYALLCTQRKTPAQLALAKRCANVAPNEFIAVHNYGAALMRAGLDSLPVFRRALELAAPHQKAMVLHHLGLAHNDRGEYDTALNWYKLSFEQDKDEPKLAHSIAIAKLGAGRLKEGLYEFEVKHHVPVRKAITHSKIPRWNGQDLKGKTVILAHEQGFGDTLQFIRFAPLLKARCKRLIFSGPDALAPLIAEQFDCFDDVINETGPFKADYVTSCMASMALMGIEYKDVNGLAYMTSAPVKLPERGRLKVGLSWKGSPGYENDALRSSSLDALCPLFDVPGAAFYSLQVSPGSQDISAAGLDGFIADLGSTLKDFRDTAAAIAAMDVIVTVDSANSHLAGALGKPVLMMLGKSPCWRWMQGNKTPWYRGHKIFRQSTVDVWPIEAVRRELEVMIGGRAQVAA